MHGMATSSACDLGQACMSCCCPLKPLAFCCRRATSILHSVFLLSVLWACGSRGRQSPARSNDDQLPCTHALFVGVVVSRRGPPTKHVNAQTIRIWRSRSDVHTLSIDQAVSLSTPSKQILKGSLIKLEQNPMVSELQIASMHAGQFQAMNTLHTMI